MSVHKGTYIAHAGLKSCCARLGAFIANFAFDREAAVNVMYAVVLVPSICMVGLGTDWFQQQSYNKRLSNAADAAAIAAVTTAKAYIVANPNDSNASSNARNAGIAQAQKIFSVNYGTSAIPLAVTPQIDFPPPVSSTYTATVSYSANMPTNFGRILGTNSFPVKGNSTSSVTLGLYLDFYVAVDVSGSMGIPTSTDGQNALAAVNPDSRNDYPSGCVFACHYSGSQGYTYARNNNITLRIDTVGQAINQMITTAKQQAQLNGILNEYRIGLYPYIVHAIDAAPLSADFNTAQNVASNLGSTYLDQGWSSNPPTASNGTKIGSGGTHFENFTNDLPNYVKSYGNGLTAAAPLPYLFLITDGVNNSQTYPPFNGSNPALPDTSFCGYAKYYGFKVAVLYIPYVPISNPNPNFAGNEDGKVNAIIPQVPDTLKACASPGFFFTASSQTDIQNAMQTMFFQAVLSARLTQ